MQRPQTLGDAIVLAERCDQSLFWARGGQQQRSSIFGRQQQRQNFRNASQYSGSRVSGPSPMVIGNVQVDQQKKMTCYHCGKQGHVRKNCWLLQQQQRGQQKSGDFKKQQFGGNRGGKSSSKN